MYPQRIKAEIVEFEDESKLKAWLPSAISKLRNAPPKDSLPSVAVGLFVPPFFLCTRIHLSFELFFLMPLKKLKED